MRKRSADYQELMKLDSWWLPTSSYRNMLDNIHPRCYVEASSTGQHGTVESVIRNKDGIPVCIKVRYGDDEEIDYISVDRVSLWEPYDGCVPDSEYFSTFEEDEQALLDSGYWWDEEKGVYVNEEGDEVVW